MLVLSTTISLEEVMEDSRIFFEKNNSDIYAVVLKISKTYVDTGVSLTTAQRSLRNFSNNF